MGLVLSQNSLAVTDNWIDGLNKPDAKYGGGFWSNLSVSALEADIAYFEARLELVGEPETIHQNAQMKTYQALEKTMIETLAKLRGES